MAEEEKNEQQIALYNQYYEYLRYYDRILWEIPAIMVAVDSGIILAAYQDTFTQWPVVRGLLILIAFAFSFALTASIFKHRIFQVRQSIIIDEIEKGWKESGKITNYALRYTLDPKLEEEERNRKEDKKKKKMAKRVDRPAKPWETWLYKNLKSAVTYLKIAAILMTTAMFLLAFYWLTYRIS